MMARLRLRWRLAVFVTAVFALAMAAASVAIVRVVENDLVDDTRSSAETVLIGYLESIYGGVAAVGVVGEQSTTQFFYLDDQGNEIDEFTYFETIAAAFDAEFRAMLEADGVLVDAGAIGPEIAVTEVPQGAVVAQEAVGFPIGTIENVVVDPETGALLDATGTAVTFFEGPVPMGEPQPVHRGDDVVAVAQTLVFADGATLEVGVSAPLQPVTDSIDTITRLFIVGVPLLALAVGGITWLAATRALRPVHAIASEAQAITATQLDQRLPVPAANDEVRELATTVNDMLGRIEHGQRQQRQLVADASHELRSPVAASRAQLEVARRSPDDADWLAVSEVVLAEQEHLSRLVDDLLALSRIEEAGVPRRGDVDLDDVVLAEAYRPHGVPIAADDIDPARIRGDQGLIERAVRNLVDNAAHHARSQVQLVIEQDGDVATLHVDDDGPGVDVDDRDRIFDRFARLDQARDRESGGAGLGLAIVHAVAHAHDGRVACTDSPLGGARFSLTLPSSPR